MSTRPETPADSTLVTLYAAITVDDSQLFLAQNEIRSLEPVAELEPAEPPLAGVGWISFDGQDWPVYCLGSDLHPSDHLPETRRICILLSTDQGYFGVLCDRLEMLSGNRLQPVPLPAVMRSPDTAVQALVLHEDAPGCVLSAVRLLNFLEFCASLYDPPANPVHHMSSHGGSCDA